MRVIIPFPAGAATDIVGRVVTEQMSKRLNQPFVVDNRPGAGGTIGELAVVQAEADGYTILVHSNSHTLTPWTYKGLKYDGARDFTGIVPLSAVPMAVVTAPESNLKNVQDLVRLARSKPGGINHSSSGNGGATHLGAERLRMAANFPATHVPYKGSAEAIREVMSGRVEFHVAPLSLALPQIQAGKLVALAAASSKRSDSLPNLATSVEQGIADSYYDVWIGMFANSKTPPAITARLADEAINALRSPEIKARYTAMSMDLMPMTMAEFNEFRRKDFEVNRKIVEATGTKAD